MRALKKVFLKETILIFMFLILVFMSISQIITPTGAISKDQDFKYQQLADDNYQIISYLSIDSKVEIPRTYKKNKVTAVERKAFFENKTIEELEVSSDIDYFGKDAFLGCDKFKKIIVPEGISEKYVGLLDATVLGEDISELVMYEGNVVSAIVDGILIDRKELQNGIYFYDNIVGSELSVELQFVENPTYKYKQGAWEKVIDMKSRNVSDNHAITWYFQSVKSKSEKIIDGNKLDLQLLQSEDSGLYTAKEGDEIVFRLQLDVKDEGNIGNAKVNTGDGTQINLLMFLGIGVMIIVYSKNRRNIKR